MIGCTGCGARVTGATGTCGAWVGMTTFGCGGHGLPVMTRFCAIPPAEDRDGGEPGCVSFKSRLRVFVISFLSVFPDQNSHPFPPFWASVMISTARSSVHCESQAGVHDDQLVYV